MVMVYAIALGLGILALILVIMGSAFAANVGRADPNLRLGTKGRMALAALLGFGMGGIAAEFSPLDLSWPIALVLATLAAGVSVAWVRYAGARTDT